MYNYTIYLVRENTRSSIQIVLKANFGEDWVRAKLYIARQMAEQFPKWKIVAVSRQNCEV